MYFKFVSFGILVLCLVGTSVSYDFVEENLMDRVRDILNEADYDNYVKNLDMRVIGENVMDDRGYSKHSPDDTDTMERHVEGIQKYPKIHPRFSAIQNREVFPERDFEGNCPPGFRTDKSGNCREIW